jgi:uncharacterized protein
MRLVTDICRFIERQPEMMQVLGVTEALGLPDCWVGAGFVRNPVWDALHGFPWVGILHGHRRGVFRCE